METAALEGTQAKVYLVLMKRHCALFRPLSVNIMREVGAYLDVCSVLGIMKFGSSLVKLLDVTRNRQLEMRLKESIPPGSVMCAINKSQLVLVLSTGVTKILDLQEQLERAAPQMKTSRQWPGITAFYRFVYVFGGHPVSGLEFTSCEKLHTNLCAWADCPSMLTPKACFTPCVYQQEIYLAVSDHQSKQLEVFTPATEQYRLLPFCVYSPFFGSVSCIVEGELFHLDYSTKIYSWRLDCKETAPAQVDCYVQEPTLTLCAGTVIHHRQFMYWANTTGVLVKFNWKDKTITTTEQVI